MKKIAAIIFSAVMVWSLTACGNDQQTAEPSASGAGDTLQASEDTTGSADTQTGNSDAIS